LIAIAQQTMGVILGNVLAGCIVFFIFITTVLVLRQIGETVIGTALPQMPLIVIMIAFTLIMAFAAYLGVESITRIAVLLLPFILIGGFLLFFLQWGNMDFDYLAPLWGPGIEKLALNSLLRSSILNDLIFIGFMAPMLPRAKIARVGVISGILATILLTGAMVIGQAIFPPPVAAQHTYPFYEIARSIYFGRFYQRPELLFVFVWVIITLMSLVAAFYFTTVGFAKIFKMPHYRPLILMMALAALGVGLLLPNYSTTIFLDNIIRGHWAWVPTFGIPGLIYLVAVLRGKKTSHCGGSKLD
jgi:spore germination protein (amino acid permease)